MKKYLGLLVVLIILCVLIAVLIKPVYDYVIWPYFERPQLESVETVAQRIVAVAAANPDGLDRFEEQVCVKVTGGRPSPRLESVDEYGPLFAVLRRELMQHPSLPRLPTSGPVGSWMSWTTVKPDGEPRPTYFIWYRAICKDGTVYIPAVAEFALEPSASRTIVFHQWILIEQEGKGYKLFLLD